MNNQSLDLIKIQIFNNEIDNCDKEIINWLTFDMINFYIFFYKLYNLVHSGAWYKLNNQFEEWEQSGTHG